MYLLKWCSPYPVAETLVELDDTEWDKVLIFSGDFTSEYEMRLQLFVTQDCYSCRFKWSGDGFLFCTILEKACTKPGRSMKRNEIG